MITDIKLNTDLSSILHKTAINMIIELLYG